MLSGFLAIIYTIPVNSYNYNDDNHKGRRNKLRFFDKDRSARERSKLVTILQLPTTHHINNNYS